MSYYIVGHVMIFHHCLSLFGQFYVLYLGTDGVEMMATLFGSELSNPFLQFRWFLRDAGCHKTWYGEVNDHLFMLLFGFLRIGVGTYLLYTTYLNPKPDIIVKLGALALYVVSWIFWYMIISYAIRKYRKMFSKKPAVTQTSEQTDRNDNKTDEGSISGLRKRQVGVKSETPDSGGETKGLNSRGTGDATLGAKVEYISGKIKHGGVGASAEGVGLSNGEVGLSNGEVGLSNEKPVLVNGDVEKINKEFVESQ